MLRSTTISITNAISSPAKFTNKDEPAHWPSGASSQPNGRPGLGVLRRPHTTWGYSDKAVRNGKLTNIREYIDTQALARASQMDSSGMA
jgi:hypothetical protein